MYFGKIRYLGIFDEVNRKVHEVLLENCDTAEFLNFRINGISSIEDLAGTKFEDIIPAFISVRDDYNVDLLPRKVFRFNLSDKLKAHIIENRLSGEFKNGEDTLLEDVSLFRNGQLIYSCVSHEDIEELDDNEYTKELMKKLEAVAIETAQQQPLYKEMYAIAQKLCGVPPKTLYKEKRIVSDLDCYVDEAKKLWAYQPPEFPCSFKKYKSIAVRYLKPETFSELEKFNNFADLQPIDGPKTVEEALKYNGPDYQYCSSAFYNRMRTELSILKEILEIKENSTLTPTLTIKTKKR